jgi:large subunit ribosomal protein L24
MHIKTNDTVIILSGRDKGKKGKVMSVDPKGGKAIVENVNVAKRHKKPRKEGEPGGIISQETPVYVSKIMRICPKCGKPTKPAYSFGEDGKKFRVCKKCDAKSQ